jgi:hypothetical protein
MFRPRCIKPLLIALALSLASCVSGSAQNPPPAQNPPNFLQHPYAITCTLPGAQARRILVPDGRNPTDFCPASRTTARIYHQDRYPLPKVSVVSPPSDLLSLQTEQDNIAKDELRALKLRNKTPGQQTPEQKTSGQQSP